MENEDRMESEVESAFGDEIDLGVLYDGPGRGEVIQQLQEAVDGGAPLMVLSGSEGSGKTVICRAIEQLYHDKLLVVFFATTVESFEDVVRRIVTNLELQLVEAEVSRGMEGAVEQLVERLSSAKRGLLLIFDEAEDIYLATLERIRKMLDRVTASGARMQILFSGRKTFLENCEQLAICDFRNSDGLHFDLPPLTEEQSAAYLRSIAEKTLPPEKQRVFNDEVARNIHGLAKGRPRRLNLLARESLRSHGNDTSFMTLLDTVQEEYPTEEATVRPRRRLASGASSLRWLVAGAGVLVIAGILLFRPAAEVKVRDRVAEKNGASSLARVERAESSPQDAKPPVAEAAETKGQHAVVEMPAAVVEQVKPEPELPEKVQGSDNTVLAPATVAEASVQKAEAVIEALPVSPPPATSVQEPKTQVKETSPSGTPAGGKVVVLKAVLPVKMRPSAAKAEAAEATKPPAKGSAADSTANLTVDQLYKKRLQAGSTWLGNDRKDKITLQLMVLTAKNASANFKKMLSQANYRQEAGNFYIFEKSGSPEVVWVFYGEYPSLEKARLAQNNLPPFLREHQPYTISVKGAVGKVQAK